MLFWLLAAGAAALGILLGQQVGRAVPDGWLLAGLGVSLGLAFSLPIGRLAGSLAARWWRQRLRLRHAGPLRHAPGEDPVIVVHAASSQGGAGWPRGAASSFRYPDPASPAAPDEPGRRFLYTDESED
jgi:hypothetical protein